MTNQTWPGAPRRSSTWSRLTGGQKASLVATAVLILTLGVLMLAGAVTGPPGRPAPSPTSSTPASRVIAFGHPR